MPASEYLKKFRSNDYSSDKPDEKKDGMDSGEKVQTPRVIALTDEEKKTFEKAKPGEDLACEVHGTLMGEDGKFRVMSVAPMGGATEYGGEEAQLAGQVMQRVMPGGMPS